MNMPYTPTNSAKGAKCRRAIAQYLRLCDADLRAARKLPDRLLRCRYELKYRVSESKAAAIERFIRPYLRLDHYCRTQPDGAYPIATLYLDSRDFQLCRQSMQGWKNRFKLRVRTYTDSPDYPRFFEIKRRANAVIIKSRARVFDEHIPKILEGLHVPETGYADEKETLRQFQLYAASIRAAPVVQVRYIRRAYEGDSANRVRVTFDRQLCHCIRRCPTVSLNGGGWSRHPSRDVILEIKFTERYPAWLSQMAKCFNLRQQSVSKYVASVKQSYRSGLLHAERGGNNHG